MLPLSVLLLVLLRAKVIDEETSVKPPRNYPTPRGTPPCTRMVPSHPYTYYCGRTIWLIFGMRSAPIGNWFRGAKIFFAKKRTLGNRLISCSLMTAFGQKQTFTKGGEEAED